MSEIGNNNDKKGEGFQLLSKKLNYDLYSNAERAEQVRQLFTEEATQAYAENYDSATTKADLEKIANFILYGKNPKNDKNFVQLKEIEITQAKSAYRKKQAESLDALLEDPTAKETLFEPVHKTVYRKIKPTISREKDKDIPGMQELWNAIDELAARVSALKEEGNLGIEFYKKNHLLIELRKEQFALKDSVSEVIKSGSFRPITPYSTCFTRDTGYVYDYNKEYEYRKWRADHYRKDFGEEWYNKEQEALSNFTISEDKELNWRWVEVSKNQIDLTNAEHVYQLLELYSPLKENSWENLDCDMKYLLWELEDYIEKSHLSEARKHILIRKIDRATNEQIRDELQEKFGLNYNDNYISTIYKQMICGQIARTAQIARDEWIFRNQPEKFKVCSTCGTRLLRDTRNFIRKQNSKDGLAARCKFCDKEIREKKKMKED